MSGKVSYLPVPTKRRLVNEGIVIGHIDLPYALAFGSRLSRRLCDTGAFTMAAQLRRSIRNPQSTIRNAFSRRRRG
jgi:hypothetical protein